MNWIGVRNRFRPQLLAPVHREGLRQFFVGKPETD
jgi:hypothetical protein